MTGIEAAAVFGRSVHITGSDRASLERAIADFGDDSLTWHEVEPRLEDVFIHLLSSSRHVWTFPRMQGRKWLGRSCIRPLAARDRAGQDGVSIAACAWFIPTGSSAQ
jgi:hypothetical protein